ncbi:MAG: hypothetical protein GXO82_00805 [Chlorobi bacterium]|nr:hypothetical protein [Chlorobiota bacterium]
MKIFMEFIIVFFVSLAGNLSAQDIEARLSGATNAQGFTVQDNASNGLFTVRGDGKAGLGTGSPIFKLTLEKDGGILAKGTSGSGATLPSITGPVLIWYPRKGAFRAGGAGAGNWDDTKIGSYSFAGGMRTIASASFSTAMCHGTTASGKYSFAIGYVTTASGESSTAMGGNTTASGSYSTSMGLETTASGNTSVAMGYKTTASGPYSTSTGSRTTASGEYSVAMGSNTVAQGKCSTSLGFMTTAHGDKSTAMGYNTNASGTYSISTGFQTTASGIASTAMGSETTASGANSTAMGYKSTASGKQSVSIGSWVSTNGKTGSVILGDASTITYRKVYKNNKFYAFFDGGYHLFTNGTGTSYVYLNHNDNAWKTSSDSTKKENYHAADGEDVLVKIGRFRLGSWNYKGQDAKRYRHYGPMAQEWFAAFGHDGVGIIGNDTSLSSADVDGIAYIAIQALERRTSELREKTKDVHMLKEKLSQLQSRDESTQKQLMALRMEVSEMRVLLRKYTEAKEVRETGGSKLHVDMRGENN